MALSAEVKQLMDGSNFAHVATLISDGSGQSVPVWIGREGEQLIASTGEVSWHARNTRRDLRVAISEVDFSNPYEEVQIGGQVVERSPESNSKTMDAISHKYTGKPFPFRNPEGRVALIIEVEKVRFTKLPFEPTPAK